MFSKTLLARFSKLKIRKNGDRYVTQCTCRSGSSGCYHELGFADPPPTTEAITEIMATGYYDLHDSRGKTSFNYYLLFN